MLHSLSCICLTFHRYNQNTHQDVSWMVIKCKGFYAEWSLVIRRKYRLLPVKSITTAAAATAVGALKSSMIQTNQFIKRHNIGLNVIRSACVSLLDVASQSHFTSLSIRFFQMDITQITWFPIQFVDVHCTWNVSHNIDALCRRSVIHFPRIDSKISDIQSQLSTKKASKN